MSETGGSSFTVKEENKKKLLKFLGVDMYENKFSTIDELFTNARTAVKKADMFFDDVEKHVIITIDELDNGVEISFRDTGIGIDWDTIDTLESIAESDTSKYEGLTGTFGNGFYSALQFVSIEGCFYMRSRSRETDELITGRWDASGFTELDNVDGVFDGDWDASSYGTEFQMIAPDIDGEDLFEYITELITYVQIPVTVEYTRKDSETVTQTFGSNNITDAYSETGLCVSFDFEDFVLHVGSGAHGDAYLNKIPIKLSQDINGNWPHVGVDLEMFVEERKVFRGPHEGTLIFESQDFVHEGLDEDEYILESQLVDEDIEYPYPSGTREILNVPDSFVSFVKTTIQDAIEYAFSSYSGRLSDAESAYEKANTFTWNDLQIIYDSVEFYRYEDVYSDRIVGYSYLEDELEYVIPPRNISDGLLELAQVLTTTVEYKTNNERSFGGRLKEVQFEVGYILQEAAIKDEASVYVSVTENELKVNAAIDTDERNSVAINLEHSLYYDVMTQFDNVKRLSNITKTDIEMTNDLSDVTERLYNKKYDNLSITEQKKQEKVVVRFEDTTEKISVATLEDDILTGGPTEIDIQSHSVEKLVVFTEESPHNIFDFTSFKNDSVALVRIDSKYQETLLEHESVTLISELVANAKTVSSYKCPDTKFESLQRQTGFSNVDVCIVVPDGWSKEKCELIGKFAPSFYDTCDICEVSSLCDYSFGGIDGVSYAIITRSNFIDGFGKYPELTNVYSFAGNGILPVEYRGDDTSHITDTKLSLFKKMIENNTFTTAHKYCLETASKPLDDGGEELVTELFN